MTAYRKIAVHNAFAEVVTKCDNLSLSQDAALYLADQRERDLVTDETFDAVISEAQHSRVDKSFVKQAIKDASLDDDEPGPEVIDDDEEWPDHSSEAAWNLGDCIMSLHSAVQKWKRLCPSSDLPELIRVIRNIADQVETKHVTFDEFADLEEHLNKINRAAWRVVFSGNRNALWFLKTVVEPILNATNEEIERLPSHTDEHKADADDWLDELFARLATAGDKALKYFGLNRRSTLDELNAIFRQQSAVMHPDAGGDAEEYKQLAQRFYDAKLSLSGKAESK